MIKPPEWGGFSISFTELTKLLDNEERLNKFWYNGVIRPVWHSKELLDEADFCLTSPGYLIWERKKKGYLYEFRIRRKDKDLFEIALCDATDFPLHIASRLNFHKDTTIPTFRITGTLDNVQNCISKLLDI